MDRAISQQFGPDHFVTAQTMRLDTATGHLQWVNADHPAPLLIRGGEVVERLHIPTTLPVGFGGERPRISEKALQGADRVLCFTDGAIEEHETGEEQFGEERLIHRINHAEHVGSGVRVPWCVPSLMAERGGATSDDATLFMVEWRGTRD